MSSLTDRETKARSLQTEMTRTFEESHCINDEIKVEEYSMHGGLLLPGVGS